MSLSTLGTVIDDSSFTNIRKFMHRVAGISLNDQKRQLVCGRLARRLSASGCADYGAYIEMVTSGSRPEETQHAIDLLTTNETHFFREPGHFDALRRFVAEQRKPGRSLRVWSAACSTGEEPYTIAMVLADCMGEHASWEVFASDLNSRVLNAAQAGRFANGRLSEVPTNYLRRYCLKGVGAQDGHFIVGPALRAKMRFAQLNLNQSLPDVGMFDVIFLRNVMIYFDQDTKREVVARLVERLHPGGWLVVGHAESLQGLHRGMQSVQPTIYRKIA
ncbi:MAG: protein-glutamate O-methyltransferase CheR [Rhodocyclaceae bacterium]